MGPNFGSKIQSLRDTSQNSSDLQKLRERNSQIQNKNNNFFGATRITDELPLNDHNEAQIAQNFKSD